MSSIEDRGYYRIYAWDSLSGDLEPQIVNETSSLTEAREVAALMFEDFFQSLTPKRALAVARLRSGEATVAQDEWVTVLIVGAPLMIKEGESEVV